MRHLLFLFGLFILLLSGCTKNKQSENQQETGEITAVSENTNIFLGTNFDLNQDISKLSLQELRILRNYPYAARGLYFMEADLQAYFKANWEGYESLIYELWERDEMPLVHSEITLSKEEEAFVEKIDARIDELQKSNFITVGQNRLGNIDNIVNLFQFKEYDPLFTEKLRQNNFVITTNDNIQLFHLYEQNDYRQIPSFITTDLYLQAFHMYFSYTLKSLEQQKFIPTLTQLCLGLYNECIRTAKTETDAEIKNLAEYNACFYAIPYYFLTGKKLEIPSIYQEDFANEISNINALEDNFSNFLSFTEVDFPYSLFKPRGHYTRKAEMESYFKAMMWLQTAPFCRDSEEQLKQTVFSAILLNNTVEKEPLIHLYQSIYEPIVFLIGEADNLSVLDIANYLKEENINSLQKALLPETQSKVNQMLIELSKTRNVIKPKIEVTCSDKINFMPQRYLIDNDVMQNLVDITPNSKRAYPKGLDVFAAFGSHPALDLLNNFHKEKENWNAYPNELRKMQDKFANYKGWNHSVYNKWIESLLELQKTDKNYPEFMQTKAWDYKNLNTSLASWAELKHDAILYGEQPMSAECGGGGPPAPIVKGYVEPNLNFWKKMAEMVSLTKNLLLKHKLLTDDLNGKTEQLAEYVDFLIQVTQKELAKQELNENEYSTIQYMGSSIEYFTLSVIDPDLYLDNWSLVEGPDKSIAVVADIYTRNVSDCNKNGVLHVANGNANNIYVVVEINGYLYLTRGATFSYYEFVQPLGTRLTDEEWQQMLEDKKAPPTPTWMKDIIIEKEPKLDERVFYSSGC